MVTKSWLRYAVLALFGVVSFLMVFILASIGPVDRTPVRELPIYQTMMERLENLELDPPKPQEGFSVGVARVNITPSHPVATAGYGKRKGEPYHTVHDSIYVRAMVIANGSARVALVSADLLIMPPAVTKLLRKRLPEVGFSLDNTYLSATHSHNSIGHWGEGATRFIYGAYEDSVVHFIAEGILRSISEASKHPVASTLRYGAIAVPGAVRNRLTDGGPEDPWFRVLEVQRSDSTKMAMVSYAAHATCLSQGTLELSRDYPGMVVDALEARDYAFAMFMAGGVGSHTGAAPVKDWACMAWMADEITGAFFSQRHILEEMDDTTLFMAKVPLELSTPQVKLSEDWKVRSWLFRAAFGEYDAFLTVLRIGHLVMLGTPCDFSGEFSAALDSLAEQRGHHSMVTSFNGGYIGYLTPKEYYDVDHYETQLMNWYAPGTGDYVRQSLGILITGVTDSR